MKKILCFSLALALIFSLAFPVFAETGAQQDEAEEFVVQGLDLPVAGKSVPKKPADALSVVVRGTAADGTKKEFSFKSLDAYWREADQENKELTSDDKFVSGRTYRIFISIEFVDKAPLIKEGETRFTVNSSGAKYKAKQGEKIEFYCDFVATPGDITPKVSLSVEGEKTKEYDGKETILTASVEKIDGVQYSYVWYRGDKLIEGATAEKLKLKNVSDSGDYSVEVTARPANDASSQAAKTTKSASQKITIKRRVVTIAIQDAEKNIFDPDPEFTYTVLGEVYDELSGKLQRLEGEDVGKYSILIGDLGFSEEVSDNYDLHVEQGTLSIIDVGELPYVAMKDVADQSYIVGKSGAKIQISAPRGALPEDAILSLSLLSADEKEDLEEGLSKKLLKGFQVKLVDETGKKLSLPRRASLRIMIPLAEEEEKFDADSITAGLLTSSVSWVDAKVQKTESVTYILVEIESLGSVALFEGDVITTEKVEQPDKVEKEPAEKKGALWMWILIGIVSLAAIAAIVATVIIQKQKGMIKKPAPAEKKKAQTEPSKEKERVKKIAEHLNSLPPVPEKNVPQEEAMQTRVVSGNLNVPQEGAMQTRVVTGAVEMPAAEENEEAVKEEKKEAPAEIPVKEEKTEPRKISFEDLEE